MTIQVDTQNTSVNAPVQLELIDSSGAHVEVTVLVGNLPPVRHAFDFTEGTVTIPLTDLGRGSHACTVVVQAFKHKFSLNRMYSVLVGINGEMVVMADGDIPAERSNDVGFGDFTLTVA
jgi:hypothetical protein